MKLRLGKPVRLCGASHMSVLWVKLVHIPSVTVKIKNMLWYTGLRSYKYQLRQRLEEVCFK